jgi:flagellar motility protein MotE (MotC chaperone)
MTARTLGLGLLVAALAGAAAAAAPGAAEKATASAPEQTGATAPAVEGDTTMVADTSDTRLPTAECPTAPAHLERISSALSRRARALDEREQSIADREASIREIETRVKEQVAQLEALKAAINAQLDTGDERRKERLAEVVKMVEANRPGTIAPMFIALEPDFAVEVLDAMNTGKAGKLLGALPAALAADLASRMAHPIRVEPTSPK